jgi:hypothetical protein
MHDLEFASMFITPCPPWGETRLRQKAVSLLFCPSLVSAIAGHGVTILNPLFRIREHDYDTESCLGRDSVETENFHPILHAVVLFEIMGIASILLSKQFP